MHPVTAHGFNFGLKGIDNLAAKVGAAFRAGRDIGSISVLESYDREHRRATYPLYVATNALVGLYTDNQVLARIARNALLRLGNALSPVKDWLLYKLTETDERRTAI
jgi:2-polyprenyl-6-methoxyphenol hydroxylase-like FAD-dependent oxidoreductase